MAGWGQQLERDRRLNARRIPWTFTDLLAAAVQCLPSSVGKRDAGHQLEVAVRNADIDGAERWPEPARELLERCRAILKDRVPVLPAGVIGEATSAEWPDPWVGAWTRRKDIGTAEEDL